MPGFDGTGPAGLGPLTGGGRGFCAVPLGGYPTGDQRFSVPYGTASTPFGYPRPTGFYRAPVSAYLGRPRLGMVHRGAGRGRGCGRSRAFRRF